MITDDVASDAIPPGGFIQRFCQWCWNTSDAPLAFHLMSALTPMGIFLPADVDFQIGFGIRPNLFILVVGGAGESRKTTSLSKLESLMEIVAPELLLPNSFESRSAMIRHLEHTPRGIMVHGEYGAELKATSQGSYRASFRGVYLELWDGKTMHVHGVTHGNAVLRNPRVSVLAASAYGLLEDHTSHSDWTSGGMSRWGIVAAARERFLALPPSRPDLKKLAAAELARIKDTAENLGPCQGLSPDAAREFVAWGKRLDKAGKTGPHAWMAPTLARLPTLALQMALAISIDTGAAARSRGREWQLDATSLRYAIRIVDTVCIPSALHLLTALSMSPFERRVRSVMEAVPKARPISYRELVKQVKPRLPARDLDPILQMLTTTGELYIDHPSARGTPGVRYSREPFEAQPMNVVGFPLKAQGED